MVLRRVVAFDACNVAVTCCDCALGALSELSEGKVVASQQGRGRRILF